jgi:hypothetical protein
MKLEELEKLCSEATPAPITKVLPFKFAREAKKYMPILIEIASAAIRCRKADLKGLNAIVGEEAWAVDDLDKALAKLDSL